MANKRRRRKRGNWFTRLSAGKKAAVFIGGLLICLIASGVIYVGAKLGKLKTDNIPSEDIIINTEVEEDLGDGYTNVALFGVDSREGELTQGTRSDCIIVASLNNKTKEIKMVSVYRDTLLDLSEGTMQKCNAAFSYGGPTLAINMLNMNLDLDIQNYVAVDFAVVSEVVDLVGGVEIDVQEDEVDGVNEYIDETASVAGKEGHYLDHAGVQTLDGVQATTYARIRHTDGGDYKRTERQRLIIEKIAAKLKSCNLATINKIIDAVFPKVSTSFSLTEMLSYAKSFAKYQIGETSGFPIDKTEDTLPGKGSVVIPISLESNVQKIHQFLFGNDGYTPSSTVISLSNKIQKEAGSRNSTPDTDDYNSTDRQSGNQSINTGATSNSSQNNYSNDNTEDDYDSNQNSQSDDSDDSSNTGNADDVSEEGN